MTQSSPKTASVVFTSALVATITLTASPALAGNPGQQAGAKPDDSADLVSYVNSRFAPRAESLHYSDPDSSLAFTLDRTRAPALLKFDHSDEIVVLSSTSGQGGAEFFKNDVGRVLLKLSPRGNVTAFRPGDDGGAAMIESGAADPIEKPVAPEDMAIFVAEQSQELKATLGTSITLTVDATLSGYEAWAADALERAVDGATRAHQQKPTRLQSVSLTFADAPSARFDDSGALHVSVAPHRAFAGRPSSDLIMRTIAFGDSRS